MSVKDTRNLANVSRIYYYLFCNSKIACDTKFNNTNNGVGTPQCGQCLNPWTEHMMLKVIYRNLFVFNAAHKQAIGRHGHQSVQWNHWLFHKLIVQPLKFTSIQRWWRWLDYVVISTAQQSSLKEKSWSMASDLKIKHLHTNLLLNDLNTGYILQHIRTYQQLNGSVKELNISIYFFFSAHHSMVFYFWCSVYWWKGVSDFSVLKYY